MFSLNNRLELRKVTISSLVSCIYLPSIVTFISYKGLLYTVGKASSFYILVLIFIAELLKAFYLNSGNDLQGKRKFNKNIVTEIGKTFFSLIGSTICFFFAIILFGAPLLENHEETLMLSSLMTLLAIFPLVAHTGVELALQLTHGGKHFSRDTIIAMLFDNALLTVSGVWLGALVIPLDWNTPWQRWPIPCYLGAIGGYLLSNVLTVIKVAAMSAANEHPCFNVVVDMINIISYAK